MPSKRSQNNVKCFLCTVAYIFIIVLVLFCIAFLILPIVFYFSTEFQRNIVFPTWFISKKDYARPDLYGISGVRNFYVNVDKDKNITLGLWHILPRQYENISVNTRTLDTKLYEDILFNSTYDIVLYLHGNGRDRADSFEIYFVLRTFFNVLACDYRGYGDSTKAELTGNAVANDIVGLYKWLNNRTNSNIFVWGHSLGTGIATHAIFKLRPENIIPTGLILEAPFTSITDVIRKYPLMKFYSWLPWFEATMIDSIRRNNFEFDSETYILGVDCPIMILHAQDDDIIPYELATRLYDVASVGRLPSQGNITYHLFEPEYELAHDFIFEAPQLPMFIEDFIQEAKAFKKQHRTKVL